MQLGFHIDQTRCTGCFTCVVACKDWHDVPAGPASWRRVAVKEEGEWPEIFVAYSTSSCYHCAAPPCVPACPAAAITKLPENGIVVVDQEACLGRDSCGGACLSACPYEAPQFRDGADPKMEKCDLCRERWAEGRKPICVDACPTRALDAGPLEELRARYGDVREGELFTYCASCRPSVNFKPKRRRTG